MKVKTVSDDVNIDDVLVAIGKKGLTLRMKLMFEKHKIEFPANNYKKLSVLLGTTPRKIIKAIKAHLAKN